LKARDGGLRSILWHCGRGVDGIGLGPCPLVGFGIRDMEPEIYANTGVSCGI